MIQTITERDKAIQQFEALRKQKQTIQTQLWENFIAEKIDQELRELSLFVQKCNQNIGVSTWKIDSVPHQDDVDSKDEILGTCHQSIDTRGVRPQCWFKPTI